MYAERSGCERENRLPPRVCAARAPIKRHRKVMTVSRCAHFVLLVLVLCAGSVQSIGQTWTGGGADGNWTTAANWDTGVPANTSSTNVSFAGTTRLTPNLNVGLDIGSVTFLSSAGAFTLSGNYLGALRWRNFQLLLSGPDVFGKYVTA